MAQVDAINVLEEEQEKITLDIILPESDPKPESANPI